MLLHQVVAGRKDTVIAAVVSRGSVQSWEYLACCTGDKLDVVDSGVVPHSKIGLELPALQGVVERHFTRHQAQLETQPGPVT